LSNRKEPILETTDREFKRRNRRSFLLAGIGAIGGLGAFRWLTTRRQEDGELWPLRRGLEVNEKLARAFFRESRLAPTFPGDKLEDTRENGKFGLEQDIAIEDWKLYIQGGRDDSASSTGLNLDVIKALPRQDMITELKCIEGWSQLVHWTGARFADFAAQYGPRDATTYVSMATPDGSYYIGLDNDSAMHPQTLLCYEMNGAPLTQIHGAPLRLAIPVKYGVKNIKRIGSIHFTNERPADYWAEQGYDWYAGH
jgi:DMSO/TMAO reductase YedYZ molybdopterin-dependent catalytic subunit